MNHPTIFTSGLCLVAGLLLSVPASAGNIGACGDINVEASANCEVLIEGGCTAKCEPINFSAACYVDCSGSGCDIDIEVGCDIECEGECGVSCDLDPGKFDCQASCELDCEAGCSGQCTSSNDKTTCEGSCKATCSGECSASCDVVLPSADCTAKCDASCKGSCKAEANIDCQIDCQAGCAAELTGGCELECSKPEGALFCDGQYIDHGGNLDACVNALRDLLDIEVSGYASASCDNGECSAEAGGSVSCATVPGPAGGDLVAWLAMVAMGGGLSLARRRRR
ncbi:MAG: hypothetical protein VB934_05450 [Polyangiaceae bacterium]